MLNIDFSKYTQNPYLSTNALEQQYIDFSQIQQGYRLSPVANTTPVASTQSPTPQATDTVQQQTPKRDLGWTSISTGLKDIANQTVMSGLAQKQEKKVAEDFVKKNKPSTDGVEIQNKGFDAKGLMSGIGQVMSPLTDAAYQNSGVAGFGASDTTNQIRSNISDAAIQSGNPYAMAIGLATKAVDGIVDISGGRAADYTNAQLDALGVDGGVKTANWFGHIMNSIPGSALLFGNVSGKKLSNAEISQDTENVRNAYAGTLNKMDAAAAVGGTGMAWFFRNAQDKMQNKIDELNERNNILTRISRTNTLAKENTYSQELNAQNQNRYSGNSGTMALGRHGMELPDKHMIAVILEARSNMPKKGAERASDESEKLPGIDTNVIPEGALHAHKNHLEEANPDMDKVTEKGIPVIATDSQGVDYQQLAEIESAEIIFRKKLTDKIEELMKDGSEKAMIRAGKLLAREIMCNTDDNTGEFLDGDD